MRRHSYPVDGLEIVCASCSYVLQSCVCCVAGEDLFEAVGFAIAVRDFLLAGVDNHNHVFRAAFANVDTHVDELVVEHRDDVRLIDIAVEENRLVVHDDVGINGSASPFVTVCRNGNGIFVLVNRDGDGKRILSDAARSFWPISRPQRSKPIFIRSILSR